MDIIEFEKAYAELIARGIDPSEFGRWLISFDERHPYAPGWFPRCGRCGNSFMFTKVLRTNGFTATSSFPGSGLQTG